MTFCALQQLTGDILVVQCFWHCTLTAKDLGSIPGQGNKVPHAAQWHSWPIKLPILRCFWKELFEYDNKLFCPKFCPLQDFHWTFTLLNYLLYFPIKLSIYHWYTFTFIIRRRSVHLFICWCFHKYLHKKGLESESRWWVFHDLLSFLWVQAKDKGNGSISMS